MKSVSRIVLKNAITLRQLVPELGKLVSAGDGVHAGTTMEEHAQGVLVHGLRHFSTGEEMDVVIPWGHLEAMVYVPDAPSVDTEDAPPDTEEPENDPPEQEPALAAKPRRSRGRPRKKAT